MSWKITFYSDKVEKETLAFPAGILANTLHIIEMIEESLVLTLVSLKQHQWVMGCLK